MAFPNKNILFFILIFNPYNPSVYSTNESQVDSLKTATLMG